MSEYSSNKTFINAKSKQQSKFERLSKHTNADVTPSTTTTELRSTVINLSQHHLTEDENRVLSLGLNFAITPKYIPKERIIQEIEPALYKFPKESANNIRVQITETLRRAKPPKSNLNRKELNAIHSLRQDKSIHILKADKGNSTVIMDKPDYDHKINELLSSTTYKKIKRDPTPGIEKKIAKNLLSLHKSDSLSNNLYRRLHPSATTCPKFYGLPKIHKPDVPLRPIVASRGTPTYNLAQHLAKILKPLVGTSSHSVFNSSTFVNEIKNIHLDENDILASFDVVSLFTNVPVDDTCDIIKGKLLADTNLSSRTNLSVNEILDLLNLCLSSTCFQWRDQFYEQTSGAAMGSPLSPILANIFMEEFEEKALANHQMIPKLWKRFVDDVFLIWSHGKDELNRFLEHLNCQHSSITFTMEIENQEHSLPFLDILLTRNPSGFLDHAVYRKPTHTDRYLNYRSFHHPRIKSSVCRTLVHRAHSICDNNSIGHELQHLNKVLRNNGFPDNQIKLNSTPPKPNPVNDNEFISTVCIPFIGPSSYIIERILRNNNIKVYHSSHLKIQQLLYSHKDKTEANLKPGVYRIPCECGMVYIGETGRNLKIRQKEHLTCCTKGNVEKSAIAKHAWDNDHCMKWNESTLLALVDNYFSRVTRESIEITKHNTIPQEGRQLNNIWSCLF